jgi:hypothetical protein
MATVYQRCGAGNREWGAGKNMKNSLISNYCIWCDFSNKGVFTLYLKIYILSNMQKMYKFLKKLSILKRNSASSNARNAYCIFHGYVPTNDDKTRRKG